MRFIRPSRNEGEEEHKPSIHISTQPLQTNKETGTRTRRYPRFLVDMCAHNRHRAQSGCRARIRTGVQATFEYERKVQDTRAITGGAEKACLCHIPVVQYRSRTIGESTMAV